MLLTLLAFIFLAGAYAPRNHTTISRRACQHPMVLGVALWAGAHLLINGARADIFLFGSFFLLAVASFIAAQA